MKKILSKFNQKIFCFFVFSLLTLNSQAQVKGLYVDFFGNYILHDATLKANLINYASAHGFNYLLLYDVQGNVLDYTLYTGTTLTSDQILLKNFIQDAKAAISSLQIGVTGGALKPPTMGGGQSQLFDNVKWFNDHVLTNQRIDVIHLEDEYWNVPIPLDRLNRYISYITQLINMWNIKTSSTYPLIVETYLGNINNISTKPETTQVADIDPITDRILLHCYMPNEFMQNRLANPGYANMQFEYDWGSGKRYKFFAGNSKVTHIIPIFSAEASDLSLSTTNYYGDYLWFKGILTNGTTCPASTATLLNYPFLALTYLNDITKPIVDFQNSYINNTDPYNETGNPGRGYPCGTPASIASCTDVSVLSTSGNQIDGEMWFKYGLMPLKDSEKPIYLDCGEDLPLVPGSPHAIHPQEFLSNIQAVLGTPFNVIKYNWYKNGEYVMTTFPVSPDYTITASPTIYVTDIYTCEIITNNYPPYANGYRIRDDVKFTSNPSIGFGLYIGYVYTPSTCPNFNNGSITVYPLGCGCTATYLWSTGQRTQTITGLSPGTYSVTATNNYDQNQTATAYIKIPSFDNSPNPVIFSSNPFVSCNKQLSVTSGYATYQWYLNNSAISGATLNTFTANQSGSYSVSATNAAGCLGLSHSYILDLSVNATITGSTSTCGSTNYTVPDAGNGANYNWHVPNGATYFQNKYFININWGPAYSTGGTISCTVTNACGSSSTNSIQVIPFLVSTYSTYSCTGLNNGTAGISTLTGGTSPYLYHWNAGKDSASQLMTSLSPGTYIVTVTDNNNCTATASTTVTNFPSNLPAPQIAGATTATPAAQLYTITNYYPAYDNNYSWSVIPNYGSVTVSYPNNNNQSAYISWPLSGGRINLSFGVQGCLQTVTYYVKGYKQVPDHDHEVESNITSGNTITRSDIIFNGNLDNTAADMSPGLSEPVDAINSFRLYPNPTTGKISLNYNLLSTENGLLEITNSLSVPLYVKKLNPESQHLEIDLSELKPAIYYFKIVVDGNQIRQGMISIIR